jgi:hypothetical protein
VKRIQVTAFDDVAFKADKSLVPATMTVTIGWRGKWRELDLSAANFTTAQRFMETFFAAGHEPGEIDVPRGRRGQEYYKGLREFAMMKGRSDEVTKYATGYRYGDDLRRDYDAYLAKQAEQGDG